MATIVSDDYEEALLDAAWLYEHYHQKHYVYQRVYSDGSHAWVVTSDAREWANREEFR